MFNTFYEDANINSYSFSSLLGTKGYKNKILMQAIFYKMFKTVMSIEKWEGLINGVTSRYIEQVLNEQGVIGMYKSSELGLVMCEVLSASYINSYDLPTDYTIRYGNITKSVKSEEIEICYNNVFGTSSMILIVDHARKVYDAEQTLKLNLKGNKVHAFIVANQKTKLSMTEVEKKLDNDEFFIHAIDGMNLDAIKAISLNVPQIFLELKELCVQRWNDFYSDFGINSNPNSSKKERVNTLEVQSNNQIIFNNRYDVDHPRQDFCRRVNARWGLSMTVINTCDLQENLVEGGLENANDINA